MDDPSLKTSLPILEYVAVFGLKPITRNSKNGKMSPISKRKIASGKVYLDSKEYRVEFTGYDDIVAAIEGVIPARPTTKNTYITYLKGIELLEGHAFSPVLSGQDGCMGQPVMITKGDFEWLPYFTLTQLTPQHIALDYNAIDISTDEVFHLYSLITKPGQLVFGYNDKPRWTWKPFTPSGSKKSASPQQASPALFG